ncbi:MAG: YSC84-related protein, partial [Xanthomonadales bacterium]|nr:YSC84-related protein [Xanthomonadales bacterium]
MFLRATPFLLALVLAACVGGSTGSEKRAAIHDMERDVLAQLYKAKPNVQAQLDSAAGYGVFSNANVYLIIASVGGGVGVVHNNRTGKDTYMKMGEAGVGLGAGVKDYRLVFVFNTEEALDYFTTHGWSFGGQADAAAKAGDKGGAVGGEIVVNNVTIYQITETGL